MLEVSKLHSGRLVRGPLTLKPSKRPLPAVVILLVLKLHSGRVVKPVDQQQLNNPINRSPTVVMLSVLKLPAGRLVRAPASLNS
jgi:hypothetical protein